MKLAIVTRADESTNRYTHLTHPHLKRYAKECDADFIILDHDPPLMSNDNKPHWRILKIRDLLEKDYDRILHLDSDMIINKNCPNIFEIVPEDHIGLTYEDVGPFASERREKLIQIQKRYGDIGWKKGYVNSGTFILSRMHRDIYTPIKGEYWPGDCSVDPHVGYQIYKMKFKVHVLDYRFNHTPIFSLPWNGSPSRFNSYIIHEAGGQGRKVRAITNVVKRIYG